MFSAGFIVAVMAACPEEARIAEGLARAAPAEVRAKYRWAVTLEGDSMRVALLDARGAVVRERVVPAPAKCAERETVAVAVLGAWLVTAPELTPAPPEKKKPALEARAPVTADSPATPDIPLAPSPSPARGAAAPDELERPKAETQPPPPARPQPAEPPPPAGVASADSSVVSAQPAPGAGAAEATSRLEPSPPPPPPALRFELALDTRAHYAGALAPGFGLTASFGTQLSGFLELSTALARKLPLPPGDVLWLRVALGAGARYRFDLRYLYVEPALSLEGAWVRFEGIGFRQNAVATGFDLSVCGQTRLGRVFSDAVGIFLGVRGCAWPLQSKVEVTSVTGYAPLPLFELSALLGISGGYSFMKGPAAMRPSEI